MNIQETKKQLQNLIEKLDDDKVAWTEKWKIIQLIKNAENYIDVLDLFPENENEILEEAQSFIVELNDVVDRLHELA